MTAWAESVAALLLATSVPALTADDGVVDHEVVFDLADRDIHESSGLADVGRVVYTVNDSGSDPVLYALDPGTGETVGTTTYASEAEDTEALARGRGRRVWVGDIGDNLGRRPSVAVYDVRPGHAGARRFELTYPDGPRDAEALLAHPHSDRLFVVSKRVFGGVVYAAPRTLAEGRPNELAPFARVPGLVTGGEFLPDGDHVVLRTYGAATVFTFPGFEPVGTVTLPGQEQGEALSVGPDGRVLVSSEGIHAEVLRIDLPAALTHGTATSAGDSSASSAPVPSAGADGGATGSVPGEPEGSRADRSEGFELRDGLRLLAGVALLAAIGWRLRRLWRRSDR